MQHDGKLQNFPFRGPFFINKKSAREQLLQKNHKNGSLPKEFNKNTHTSKKAPPKTTTSCHQLKANPVRFEDQYDNRNPMENTHEYTNIIDTQEQNIEDAEVEQEELFEYTTENMITE